MSRLGVALSASCTALNSHRRQLAAERQSQLGLRRGGRPAAGGGGAGDAADARILDMAASNFAKGADCLSSKDVVAMCLLWFWVPQRLARAVAAAAALKPS
jgi:hypothetical protein